MYFDVLVYSVTVAEQNANWKSTLQNISRLLKNFAFEMLLISIALVAQVDHQMQGLAQIYFLLA